MENTHSMSSSSSASFLSFIDPFILTPGAARGPLFTGMAMVPTSIPSSARKYGELRKLRGVGRPPIMLRKRIGSSLLVALAPRCENGGRSATCSTLPSTSARGNEGEGGRVREMQVEMSLFDQLLTPLVTHRIPWLVCHRQARVPGRWFADSRPQCSSSPQSDPWTGVWLSG